MLRVRSIREADIDGLMMLASHAKKGLTTLPHDREVLQARIDASIKSTASDVDHPGGETYLFVLEDVSDQSTGILGVCGVVSKIGGYEPHWTFAVDQECFRSESLQIDNTLEVLKLKANHNGPTEIGTLFLLPQSRGGDAGRLLSLSRFLFIAAHASCFEEEVIAELRGCVSDDGQSVFWEAVGRHFFKLDFAMADLISMKSKRFIDELMPRHPLYVSLLPKDAQAVIAQVHENTRPARRLLEQEGFSYNGEVDIFEAGPVMSCHRDQIRTVSQTKRCEFHISDGADLSSPRFLVACAKTRGDFRCIVTEGMVKRGRFEGPREVLAGLNCQEGDVVWVSPLRHKTKR